MSAQGFPRAFIWSAAARRRFALVNSAQAESPCYLILLSHMRSGLLEDAAEGVRVVGAVDLGSGDLVGHALDALEQKLAEGAERGGRRETARAHTGRDATSPHY